MKIFEKRPDAWVVSTKDRGRKSIKNGKVYLNDGDEFEIELFNPLNVSVLADIKLNGSSISKNGLVIKPGQRIYLDCFIEDKRKFKFSTYNVENTEEVIEAIKQNGLLEVSFYKELVKQINLPLELPIIPYQPYNNYPKNPWETFVYCSSDSNFTIDYQTCSNTSFIETGRIEKGGISNTEFSYVDIGFEPYSSYTTSILILPESRKPLEHKDIMKNNMNKYDIIELIKKLSELHSVGVLTEEEYNNKKTELLSKI